MKEDKVLPLNQKKWSLKLSLITESCSTYQLLTIRPRLGMFQEEVDALL